MKWVRRAAVLAILASLLPLASTLAASLIAQWYGCRLNEGSVNPCMIGGMDWGATLYNLFVMGWLMLLTLPIAMLTGLAWIVTELVRLARSRQPSE